MKLHELNIEAKPSKRRRGRGIAAGLGKTSGRGTKGQNSRTGGGVKLGFEGGQTKFSMRLPKKRGFTAKNPTIYQIVTTTQLADLGKTTINQDDIVGAGLARKNQKIKLLFATTPEKKYTVSVDAASQSAIAAVEKAGGKVVLPEKKLVVSKKSQKSTSENATAKK